MGILDGDYYEKQTRKFQLEMLANARAQTEMLSDIYIYLKDMDYEHKKEHKGWLKRITLWLDYYDLSVKLALIVFEVPFSPNQVRCCPVNPC